MTMADSTQMTARRRGHAVQETRGVVLIGFPGAGKTHLLAGLALAEGSNTFGSVSSMLPETPQTAAYLRKIEPKSGEPGFTHGTEEEDLLPDASTLVFRVNFDGQESLVAVSDSMGKDWLNLKNRNDTELNKFVDDLGRMSGVIFVIDSAFIDEGDNRRETVDGILRTVLEAVYSRWPQDDRPDGKLPLNAALVLSKSDRFFGDLRGRRLARKPVYRDGAPVRRIDPEQDWSEYHFEALRNPIENGHDGTRRFLVEHCGDAMRAVVLTLEQYFSTVGYHAVSFVGMVQSGERVIPNLVLRPLNRRDQYMVERRSVAVPTPINLHSPFVQVLWHDDWLARQRRARRVNPTLVVGFAVVAVLVSVLGYMVWSLTRPGLL